MFARALIFTLSTAATLAVSAPGAAAQLTAPSLGVGAGVSRPPAALQDACAAPSTMAVLEARAGLGSGPLSLEARGSVQAVPARHVCVWAEVVRPDGVHTEREYPFQRGDLATTDLRARFAPAWAGALSVTAGGGWLWTHGLPYLVGSVGARTAGRLRWQVELEHSSFRVPFDEVRREWKDRVPVRDLGRERVHRWQGGWGMRAGVGVGI